MRADLHLHTTASDGLLSPEALVARARSEGVDVIAVTDHDNVAGLAEATRAGLACGVTVLPGVEISAAGDREVHILGYGMDVNDARFVTFVDKMLRERLERLREMVRNLQKQGIELDADRIISDAGHTVGRPHIARAMVAKGYVADMPEAFDRYLGSHCPAYVPRWYIAVEEVAQMLLSVGATPVLAHPALLKTPDEHFLPLLKQWVEGGIKGLEVYHPANRDRFAYYDGVAREMGLLVTGGSDYHDDARGRVGETSDAWTTARADVDRLMEAIT